MSPKKREVVDLILASSSGTLQSTLGGTPAGVVARPYPGETREAFRQRVARERELARDLESDPRRDGSGRVHPIRYE